MHAYPGEGPLDPDAKLDQSLQHAVDVVRGEQVVDVATPALSAASNNVRLEMLFEPGSRTRQPHLEALGDPDDRKEYPSNYFPPFIQ